MISYVAYFAIFYGSILFLVSVVLIILLKIPLQKLTDLLESVFHFRTVRNLENRYIIINVCNDKFELSKTVWSRIPFIIALGMCLLVIILVFIEGCIFSARHVYAKKQCSDRIPNCYLFKARFTSLEPFYQYVCEGDHPVIPANMSANYAVCYGFVLPDQTSIDLLNQLGVCTGILQLVDYIYPLAYRWGRRKSGRAVLLTTVIVLIATEIFVLAHEWNISFMTIVLLTLAEVLIGTILYLQYRKVKYPINDDRVGTYIPLDSCNSDDA